MPNLPTGTVTFLFTDIEGSTKLALEHPVEWESLRARHHAILQSAIESYNGHVFQIIGDAFCAAFSSAGTALCAAVRAQTALQSEPWQPAVVRVRMGIHTGKAEVQTGGDYQGYLTLMQVQRVMSVAHGGQILISNSSAGLVRGELPKGISLLDMHEHQLKGLVAPEHLWQIAAPNLQKDFPPLQSLNEIPNNLPVQLTSFIGREQEIAELRQALREHHLITLTGSGGTGKTRLSLQVATDVMDSFPGGVWFLELAPVSDPAFVPYTLANVLGLRESAESEQTITELVTAYFHSRRALLIFDNCEHLIEACARFAVELLRSCKDIRILTSSREALGVEGEMVWHVPSLSLPDIKHLPALEQLSQYEAVRLFVERAKLVQPHFAVTQDNAPALAQICFRLDGIPLAIELAAARANVLTVEQISRRLDDRFRLLTGGARTALPRQQTLRAMIDWSYNLLSDEERLLFRRLAVFVGGWTLEAAEVVCSGEGIESGLVLDLLSQLVKKSLVVAEQVSGESRYHLLETIRQYAREKLFETEEAAHIRDRHLHYFIQFADQGFQELYGPNDAVWFQKLEMEHDNLRAALAWSLESPGVVSQEALQLSGALRDFWDARGYTTEGYEWTNNALKKAPDTPTAARCRALSGAALLCIRISRFEDAVRYLQDALEMAQRLDYTETLISNYIRISTNLENQLESRRYLREGIALARASRNQFYLAMGLSMWALLESDDAPEALRSIEEAYRVAENLGSTRLRAHVLWAYGTIRANAGRHDEAASMVHQALHLSQQLQDKHSSGHCLLMLGRIASDRAIYSDAFGYEQQSLQLFRDLSDRECSAKALEWLGWNASLAGDPMQAREYLSQSVTIFRQVSPPFVIEALVLLGRVFASSGDFHQAREIFLETFEQIRNAPPRTDSLARGLEGVCALPSVPPDKAAQLLGKAEAIREQVAYVIPISERHLIDPIVERLQAQLGREAFDSARAAGNVLTHQQAIDGTIRVLRIEIPESSFEFFD